MGHQGPGNAIDAGIACEYAFCQLGQLAVIACGQVVLDVADLLLDHMEIIQQPLCRRRDGMLLIDFLGDGFIGFK